MYKGGPGYTPHSAKIFRYGGLIAPFIVVAYGALIKLQLVPATIMVSNTNLLLLLSFFWLCIGFIQFFIQSKTAYDSALRLTAYHLLAGACLVFVSGVTSPFSMCWMILMIVSYTYFSIKGLTLSILSLVVVAFADIALWYSEKPEILVNDLVTLAAILVTSIVMLSISHSQVLANRELDNSKIQELLQRDRTMTIVNNMADAVISTDFNGTIKVYNAASLDLLDTNDNLNGHHVSEILPLIDQEGHTFNLYAELQGTKSVIKRDDLDYMYKDGEKIRLEITYSPIHNSFNKSKKATDGYIIIMRDVTKAKSLEEERDEFISVTSHELRTPIAIAEGTLSNVQMMMDHPNATNDMKKEAIKTAHDQILFLANMINDLSTLSRAERGVADEGEDIDVNELAHNLLNKYMADAKKKGLHLNLDLAPNPGKVHVSRLYIEELLQNFMTNAIKYTQKGDVTIIIESKNDKIIFAVKDSGIGISKSDQEKIFNKFYRSEDYRTRETGGTGLGLYVAAKLARKLDTRIQLSSRLNFGSTFSFKLPKINESKK